MAATRPQPNDSHPQPADKLVREEEKSVLESIFGAKN
jgi:hypothetical protein